MTLSMNSVTSFIPKLAFSLNRSAIVRMLGNRKLYSTEVRDEIKIPKRIPRGPTDILRALESTVKRDPTAAHYKYHDDPFLIPMSNLSKRTFAMAQESGRKAAHWVRQENAELFQHKEADPMIKAFAPKVVYNKNSDVTEEDLVSTIKDTFVSDACLIYKLLKEKGVAISEETQQSLLELLCYYNHEDPIPEEFIEERWFRQSNKGKERLRKTWQDNALSEEIFVGFSSPNGEVYSAMIQGMLKYGQIEKSWQLYEDSQQKNLLISADAYNSIISAASYLKEDYDLRWAFVVDILSAMAKAQVKPNLGTLNAVLKSLSAMGSGNIVKQNVLKTLAEFKALGIEPSLASWYYVLIIYYKERGPTSSILYDIINHLDGKQFTIQDLRDTFFFITAMDICNYHLKDKELAKKIHNLLLLGNNYNLIGDSFKESIYYRHYVTLLCSTEPTVDFIENVYYQLVPHVYIPEPSVMLAILKSIEANGAIEYIPKLWSDMIIFDHTEREDLLSLLINIMLDNWPVTDVTLKEQFLNVTWGIWEVIYGQTKASFKKINITGDMLGKIIMLLLQNKNFQKACTVMDVFEQEQQSILGVPSFEAFSLFVENCIEQKLPTKAINCIQLASDIGFEDAANLAIKLNESLILDETHLKKLTKIVGTEVLQKKNVN